MSIIVLAERQILGGRQAMFLMRSDQGDTSWHLLRASYTPPAQLASTVATTLQQAIDAGEVEFVRAGSIPTLLHGLVDLMADWGASDNEIIPLADFIPRLEELMAEVKQALVELVQDREVI